MCRRGSNSFSIFVLTRVSGNFLSSLCGAIVTQNIGSYLPISMGSFIVRVIDALTMPTGEMEVAQLLDYQVPRQIVAYFLIEDESPSNKNGLNWSVELRIRIASLGTPVLESLTHRGLSIQKQITVDGIGNYVFTAEHSGVSRKQIALVEKNLSELIDQSLSLMLESHFPTPDGGFTVLSRVRKVDQKDLLRFRKEMRNRAAKTRLTPEFLSTIAKIYQEEVARSKKAGDRCRTTEVIREATGFRSSRGTVEAWVSKARSDGFLSETEKKKVSAPKAGSKSKTKQRRGSNDKKQRAK